MRAVLIVLIPLLLAGCVNESASYYVDDRDHALSVRAEQEYFWSDELTLRLVAARLPDCQRLFALGTVPVEDLDLALYSSGENRFLLHAGERNWQVDTQGCTAAPVAAQGAPAERLGSFHLNAEGKLVFEKAGTAALPAKR